MATILVVRHAQASFGAADYDRLSETGHAQAAALTHDLRRRGVGVDRPVSGSLRRQRETAEPVAATAGRQVRVDPRFDEYDVDDVLTHHSATLARPERRPGSQAPPITSAEFQDVLERALLEWIAAGEAGPTLEPYPAFVARASSALSETAAELPSGSTALVCTSGGVLAALCVTLLDLEPPAFVAFNRVAVNAGVSRIVTGRRGTTLVSFNEQAHLEGEGRSLITYR